MKRQKIRKVLLLVSALLFPITINYLSPFLIIMGGFGGILSGSALLFTGQFITSLIFGRAFCGWICPAGGLQFICSSVSGKRASRRLDLIKYVIWVPWLAAIVLGFISAGGIKYLDPVYRTDGGISITSDFGPIIYFSVVALIVILSLTLGKRAFCHSVCWMAPFMVTGSFLKEKLRLPSLRLRADSSKCTGCGTCEKNCPMSLPVRDMAASASMYSSECILCASCADSCPQQAITLGFRTHKTIPAGKEVLQEDAVSKSPDV